jgi:hypothetical protein
MRSYAKYLRESPADAKVHVLQNDAGEWLTGAQLLKEMAAGSWLGNQWLNACDDELWDETTKDVEPKELPSLESLKAMGLDAMGPV